MIRYAHVAAVIGGVVAAAARDAGRSRLVIVDWAAPESDLLEQMLSDAGVELPIARASGGGGGARDVEALRTEARRLAASDALLLDPVNKTIALLWPERLAEPVLPLADLYASRLPELGAAWSAPDDQAGELIARAGGVAAVDRFLTRHLEERRPLDEALAVIPDPDARAALAERLRAGWWWRRRVGVVPKLGGRTLGIDLR